MQASDKSGLVLGGGGITGIAWELGLLAGLAEAGVDLLSADLIIGTSAGSVVGAQIASSTPVEALYLRQLEPPSNELPARLGARERLVYLMALLRARGDLARFGRLLGAMSLRAASCAVPGVYPPIPIGDRTYIDGGFRSSTNADLASGCAKIVVLAPMSRRVGPLKSPQQQLAGLGASIVIEPDPASRTAIGNNVLDPAARRGAAQAGRAQAAAVVEQVRGVWS